MHNQNPQEPSRRARRFRLWEEQDDGRTIAPMDAGGLAQGEQRRSWLEGSVFDPRRHLPPEARAADQARRRQATVPALSRKEARRLSLNVVLAGLMIAGIYLGLMALFLLFCQFVWFR
ncbi:MAG: hypothetical protein PHR21_10210 [Oscillospiraceae bacterium]|nr:hypothetical protein [Oscillospiraceae bacterium]MDD4368044.1 hypothetical protein [Oscillospiraceae bacterium]